MRTIIPATIIAAVLSVGAAEALARQAPAPIMAPPPPIGRSAEELIADAGGDGLLVAETSAAGHAVVRHPASGLTCRFPLDAEAILLVRAAPRPRGDDIICNWSKDDVGYTVWAKPAEGVTPAGSLAAEIASLSERWSNAQTFTPPSPGKAPRGVAEQWITPGASPNGGRLLRMSVFERRGWLIEMTAVGQPDEAPALQKASDATLARLVADADR